MSEELRAERDLYLRLLELGSHDELEPFLDEALGLMCEVTGARKGWLALFAEGGGLDDPPAWSAAKGAEQGDVARMRREISEGILKASLASGKTVSTASALEDPRFSKQASVQASRISAVLCAPLGGTHPVGILYLQERPEPGPFGARDVRMVEAFAAHVAPLARRLVRHAGDLDHTAPWRARLGCDAIVGRSKALAKTLEQLSVAAGVDMTVLLVGESGTGKTELARALHRGSARAKGPFVELNCAALPEALFEAELFGAEKGAHSTATKRIQGKVAAAEGGTLLLDEIGEIPLPAQAKLLTFLQSKTYFPLGSSKAEKADVRLVAATNADLEQAVKDKRFREDLYWRLGVLVVRVPSLRERPEDVPLLADHVAKTAMPTPLSLSWDARSALARAEWPGNVRQLSAAVQRGAAFAAAEGASAIEARHVFPDAPPKPAGETTYQDALRHFQRALLREALDRSGGNVAEAARALDLSRSHLYELMKAVGLK